MIFIDTKRFSPVIYENDLPFKEDYFHLKPKDITPEFLAKGDYDIDEEWWRKQEDRCKNGYVVKDAIMKGGDAYPDGIISFWYGNDCEIPMYNLVIKNRELFIQPRLYWYLNFWKLYGLAPGTTVKDYVTPKFIDIDYFFARRMEMMVEEGKNGFEQKARQIGFELPDSEMVLTIKGWKRNGDLKIGDYVATRKGTYTKIKNVYKQGVKDVYEMILMDGRKVRCGLKHKWLVYYNKWKGKKERVVTTEDILNRGLTEKVNRGKNISYMFRIPDIEPVSFNENAVLPIDPYLMGLLIGDGDYCTNVRLSSIDIETGDTVRKILGSNYDLTEEKSSFYNGEKTTRYTLKYIGKRTKEQKEKYGLKSIINKFNPIVQEIKLLGLTGATAKTKSIPDVYKHSSIEQRKELIRGLMDSDGYISPDGLMEFKTISPTLANDVAYVLRSLGVRVKMKEFKSKQGYNNYFRLYISTTLFNPFKLKRKAERFNPNKKIYRRNPIVSLIKLDYKEESTCIEVEDEDHLYLTTDFIPTHNSEKMGGMNLGWNFTFVRASQNVIVAGTDADQQNTFNKTKNGLDNLKNTQFYKERKRGGNSSDFLEAEDFKSQLYGLTAKDNPQAVSRLSPYMAVLEEGGKWKKNQLIEAYNYIRPSQKAEGIKTGWCMIGGTGGKGDSGVEDMQDICYSPGSYEILSFPNVFEPEEENITGQVGHFTAKSFYYYIDEDGNSLVYKSKKKILEDRANMKPKAQYINMSQDALYLSHSFYIPTGGFFGPEIIGNLNARIAYVNNHREQQIGVPIRIDWIDPKNWSKGVKWTPDDNGLIMMYQEPKLDSTGKPVMNLYKGATDSYDQDISRTSNSKGSITIIKGFYNANESSNHWVARLLARPDNEGIEFGSIDKFSEETAKLCIMYGCQNLIEFSKILIFKWYQDNGLSYLLKERPSLVVSSWVKNSQVSNRYGIDANTKPHWLKLLRDYLSVSSNIDNMHDIEQMRAFAKFIYDPSGSKYNCDITISSALNIVSLEEEKRYIVGEREKPGPTRMVYKTINGQLKQVAI